MSYSRKMALVYPLTIAAGVLSELTVSTLSAKQVREIGKKYDTDNDPNGFHALDQEFELAVAMTGQPDDVIAQLKKPDYNSLVAQVDRLTNHTTLDLLEEDADAKREAGEKVDKIVFKPDTPTLLVAVHDPVNGDIADYRLQPPTVGLTRQLRIEKDGHKRGMMVASTCTGLHQDIIDQFHMPDFNHLMERVRDFLTQQGDFFQTATLTD
ncbi:phage tail assembly protein [Scandinavium manionii]|uniref:phage tail assembly protein n=1 Tax=Scandinavium manionii TaxID=2926520 RepID=UPI00135BC700|nr:phage tail assembly protein [Scandinavium manionii]MCS2168021.1 phage tail assembly protein [Scandinavium manionii]